MKFVQLGTQIKTRCEKKKIYKNTQKVQKCTQSNELTDQLIIINTRLGDSRVGYSLASDVGLVIIML